TGPLQSAEVAHRLYAQEAFHSSRARSYKADDSPPYSLQWFLEIPEPHRMVGAARQDVLAVACESHGFHKADMSRKGLHLLVIFQVPKTCSAVVACGGKASAVGSERHGRDGIGMTMQAAEFL